MALDFVTDHKGSGTMEIKVIVDQLSSYEITPVAEAEKNTYIETHKMIKPGQTSFYPACLYVGYASDLPDALESAANIIAIEDEPVPPSFSQAPGLNLYLAPCGTSQFDILNRIADIMIDEAAIAQMKDGAVFLNLSRDTLVNDAAMAAALEAGKVARYVTDFANPAVVAMPRAIVMPHLGASTKEAEDNCAKMAAQSVMDYLERGVTLHKVN